MQMKKNLDEYSECILAKKAFPLVINANDSDIISRLFISKH